MDKKGQDFSAYAAEWDIPPRVQLAEDVARAIRGRIPLSRTMDVLDFGCGTGLLALALYPYVRSVTGMDTSQSMLDVFQEKIQSRGLDAAAALFGDFRTRLPSPYHLIVSSMALHHIEDVAATVKMFHEALRPGGYCAVADLEPEGGLFHAGSDVSAFHDGFDREGLERMFTEAGFADIVHSPAAEVEKPLADGNLKRFSIFLMTARRT